MEGKVKPWTFPNWVKPAREQSVQTNFGTSNPPYGLTKSDGGRQIQDLFV